MTTDLGIIVTGLFAILAFGWGRGKWLRHVLMLSWVATVISSLLGASMAMVVFSLTAIDLIIAGTALLIITHDPTRTDAKIVGGISMALMPIHWIMSASHGAADWTIYASAVNAGFVLQCLIVRGWLDGLGCSFVRVFHWFRPVHLPRDNGGR